MEGLLDPKYGIAGLLVVMCLHLIFNVIKFTVSFYRTETKKKDAATDAKLTKLDLTLQQFDGSVREFRVQIGLLDAELKEVAKFKSDSQKLFSAVKIMAGKQWPKIRKAMEEDVLPK